MEKNIFIEKKINIGRTLISMRVGESLTVPYRYATASAVRSKASRLKKEGYLFTVTERCLDGIKITRLN